MPTLPMAPDNSTAPDGSTRQDVTDSANAILRLDEGDPLLWDAWQSPGEAMVDKMKGDDKWKDRYPMVAGIEAEVLDADGVPHSRIRNSVKIDLGDLSEPVDDAT